MISDWYTAVEWMLRPSITVRPARRAVSKSCILIASRSRVSGLGNPARRNRSPCEAVWRYLYRAIAHGSTTRGGLLRGRFTLQRTEQNKWYLSGNETEEWSVFTTALSRPDGRRGSDA